jgi:hypothetical protein
VREAETEARNHQVYDKFMIQKLFRTEALLPLQVAAQVK